jgi:hypothetical protein
MKMLGRIGTLAATALIAAASFSGGTAARASSAPGPQGRIRPDTIVGKETGTGATLSAAEQQARTQFNGDYYGCVQPYVLVGDGQYANGTWWATLSATCKGVY